MLYSLLQKILHVLFGHRLLDVVVLEDEFCQVFGTFGSIKPLPQKTCRFV